MVDSGVVGEELLRRGNYCIVEAAMAAKPYKSIKCSSKRWNFSLFLRVAKILHSFQEFFWREQMRPSHDDLPVLLVVGHLVGRPQLTEAAATNHKGDNSWDIL